VAWLLTQTRLPIVLKGILHPSDAVEAAQLGVAAVVVSNHGGRTLDTTPSTASMLPRVADAVQGRIALLVDGGIRRGTDVLKAIALGASAVLVGRPALYGLATAGANGVAHVLRLLIDELEIAMALTGCRTLDMATAALVLPAIDAAFTADHGTGKWPPHGTVSGRRTV
jgi:4-hydroxymandelate oxidase